MTLDELIAHATAVKAGGAPGSTECVMDVCKAKAASLKPGALEPMTHDQRRDYWDNHVDGTAEVVLRFGE